MNQIPVHKVAKTHWNQFLSLGWMRPLITVEDKSIPFLWNTTLCHGVIGSRRFERTEYPHVTRVKDIANTGSTFLRNVGVIYPAISAATTSKLPIKIRPNHPHWAFPIKKLCVRTSTQVVGRIHFFWDVTEDCANFKPPRLSQMFWVSHYYTAEGQNNGHSLTTLRPLHRKSAICNSKFSR